MARTDDALVRAIIPNDSIITDTAPFITAANLMTNKLAASPCGSDLTEAELIVVETWLAAHFAAVTYPAIAIESEKVEGASVKASRGNVASQSGLLSTQFGQMANTLSGGCLQELDKRKPSLVFA